MKLVASVMVGENETDRYLEPFLRHLLLFCDEIRVRWEHPHDPDGTPARYDPYVWAIERFEGAPITVMTREPSFFQHEGRARQELLDFTLEAEPTHILSIDADEFIADGSMLRWTLSKDDEPTTMRSWHLCMQEVWFATGHELTLRQDGGWAEHDVPVVWSPGAARTDAAALRMPDRALASGRTPEALRSAPVAGHTGTAILHFGWANQAERAARYQRYVQHDGGKHHARQHLDSIMWPDDRLTLNTAPWPGALMPYQAGILDACWRIPVEP